MENQWTGVLIDGVRYLRVMASELEVGDINVDRRKLVDISIGEYNGRVKLAWDNGTSQYLRHNSTLLIDASTVE